MFIYVRHRYTDRFPVDIWIYSVGVGSGRLQKKYSAYLLTYLPPECKEVDMWVGHESSGGGLVPALLYSALYHKAHLRIGLLE